MNIDSEIGSKTDVKRRVSVFRVRVCLFPFEKAANCKNVITSPRLNPRPRQSPRPTPVLDRETHHFESETEDLGNSVLHSIIL